MSLEGVWMCPPDMIIAPFLGRKALPGQEGEGGPDGPHGGWSKGFFIALLDKEETHGMATGN